MTLPCNYPGEATLNVFFEISLTSFGCRFELNKISFLKGAPTVKEVLAKNVQWIIYKSKNSVEINLGGF
jgi:hypothetical protein